MGSSISLRLRVAAGMLATVVAAAAVPPALGASEITINMGAGRVTLIATDAPLADVLAEWARVGDTVFVGAEMLGVEPITLHLVDAAEADAIRLLLRSAAGYIAAPRRAGASGASRYDRVTVLAMRRTPAPLSPLSPGRGRAAAGAVSGGADNPARAAPSPTLVPIEELQRLFDAAAPAPTDEPDHPRRSAGDVTGADSEFERLRPPSCPDERTDGTAGVSRATAGRVRYPHGVRSGSRGSARRLDTVSGPALLLRASPPLPDSTAHEHRAADPEAARKLREECGELVRRIEDQAPGIVADCHREPPLIRHPRSGRQGGWPEEGESPRQSAENGQNRVCTP